MADALKNSTIDVAELIDAVTPEDLLVRVERMR
jgi:hypothetical protein